MPLPAVKNRSLLSNSFFIFLIRFLPTVANLIVLLYYSRQLDKHNYGTYQNFWIQLNFIYPLACFGIHVLITTYSPEFVVRQLKRLRSSRYYMYGGWLLLLSAVFAFLQYREQSIGWLVPMLFMLAYTLGIIAESFLVIFRRFRALLAINGIYAVAYLAAHYFILQQKQSLSVLFIYLLVISIVRLVVSGWLVVTAMRLTPGNDDNNKTIGEIKKLWLNLAFYDILQNVSNWIDKFSVSLFLPAALSGVYYNGTQNIPFLPIILAASGNAVLMQLSKVKAEDEHASLVQLMNYTARYLGNVVYPLMFFLMFFRVEVFSVLFPKYMDAVPLFFIMLFILPFRNFSFITVFQKLHRAELGTAGAVGDLVLATLLMYPLYRLMGLPGMALSFIISSYLQCIFYFYHMTRLLRVKAWQLVPVRNWLVKIPVFILLFKTLHYLLSSYFSAKTSLLAGLSVMGATILIALFIEMKLDKHGNAEQDKAERHS